MHFKILQKINEGNLNFSEEELPHMGPFVLRLLAKGEVELGDKILKALSSEWRNALLDTLIPLAKEPGCHPDITHPFINVALDEGREPEAKTLYTNMIGELIRLACTHDTPDKLEEYLAHLSEKNIFGLTHNALKFGDYIAFGVTTINRQNELLKSLITFAAKAGGEAFLEEILSSRENLVFLAAAQSGNLEALAIWLGIAKLKGQKEPVIELFKAHDYGALTLAYQYGHSETVKFLLEIAHEYGGNDLACSMLTRAVSLADPFKDATAIETLFAEAAHYGSKEWACELLKQDNFVSFLQATFDGNVQAVEAFLAVAKQYGGAELAREMLLGGNYYGFLAASSKDHADTLEALVTSLEKCSASPAIFSKTIVEILTHDNFTVFRHASGLGHTKTTNILLALAKEHGGSEFVHTMLEEASATTASKGHTDILQTVIAEMAVYDGAYAVREMLLADDCRAFLSACEQGKNTVPVMLEAAEKYGDSDLVRSLLTARDSIALIVATRQSHPDTIKIVLDAAHKHGGEALVREILAAQDYAAITHASELINPRTALAILEGAPESMRAELITKLPAEWQEALQDGTPKHKKYQILGGGNERWRELLNIDAPHENLQIASPYKFKPALYDQVLPILQTAADIEGWKEPEIPAYQLAVLFSNIEEVERYLSSYASKWSPTGHIQATYDAVKFEIPQRGLWDVNRWKALLLKHGPAVAPHLQYAARIERYLEEHDLPFPKSPKELRPLAAISTYERGDEHPEFAELALQYGVPEDHFNQGLDVLRNVKTHDNLPDVLIDGDDIGHPNYYMTKLPIGDPRGLILGEITNCCQTIGKPGGQDCAIHGMTSENGGFYVWKHKTKGEITDKDNIVAQSWAWLNEEKILVFDSFERLSDSYAGLAQPFLEAFAERVLREQIAAVHLGTGSSTPKLPLPQPKILSQLDHYLGYRDAYPREREELSSHETPEEDAKKSQYVVASTFVDVETIPAGVATVQALPDIYAKTVVLTEDVQPHLNALSAQIYEEPWAKEASTSEEEKDDEAILLKYKGALVGYAVYSRAEHTIADLAVLPDKLRHVPTLLSALVEVIAEEGGEWTAEMRETTSLRLLEKHADRYGINFQKGDAADYTVDNDPVVQVSLSVPDKKKTLALVSEAPSFGPVGANNQRIYEVRAVEPAR